MKKNPEKIGSAVRRNNAESNLLISLVAFAVTVIVTRIFLQLAGFPQLGNDILHFAHALWGGLILIIAAYLPLAFTNKRIIKFSALLSGVGIGLFIDEIGKFITQSNDYFFPPALSLIYGFFLITVFVYLFFRKSHKESPRKAMYHILEELQDAIDGDLDTAEAARIEDLLTLARESKQEEILSLADVVSSYMKKEKRNLIAAEPTYWKRLSKRIESFGKRLGRPLHRRMISIIMLLWVVVTVSYVVVLLDGNANLLPQVLRWRSPLLFLQVLIGIILVIAALTWLLKKEETGLNFAVVAFLLSLIAVQTLYFYISQFSAITATLIQFIFLQILISYRKWYLNN